MNTDRIDSVSNNNNNVERSLAVIHTVVGFDRKVQLPYCTVHKSYYKTMPAFKEHLRKLHNRKVGDIEAAVEKVEKEQEQSRSLNAVEVELCKKYTKYDKDKEGTLVINGKYPNEVLPRLEVLDVVPAVQCQLCFEIKSSKAKISNHKKDCAQLRNMAPMNKDDRAMFIDVSAQSLFLGKNRMLFRIKDVNGSEDANEAHWIVEKYLCPMKIGKPNTSESDFIEVDVLVRALRCSEHLNGFSLGMGEAWKLVRWDSLKMNAETEDKLFKLVGWYMREARVLYRKNVFVKSRKLFGQHIHICLNEDTIMDYHKKIMSLFYFIHNCVELGTQIVESGVCGQYKSVFQSNVSGEGGFDSSEKVQKFLFDLLFTEKRGYSMIVPLFITCRMVHRNRAEDIEYHFGRGSDISHYLAPLLHLVQCVAVHQGYGGKEKGEVMEYEEPSQHRQARFEWDDISKACGESKDCAASYIRFCMNLCNNLHGNEAMQVRFVVCKKHRHCGLLDGLELALSSIGKAVSKRQGVVQELLDKQLFGFWGQLNGGFWSAAEQFMDNFSDRSVGFWFGCHPANKGVIECWRKRFIKHVISKGDGIIGSEVSYIDAQKGSAFLEQVEAVLKDLFWLMQVTSGGPARVTELQKCQIRNTSCTSRHIFFEQGRIMYVLFGHKGRDKLLVSKPIARYPDKETSKIMLCYLIFIRPLASIISGCLVNARDGIRAEGSMYNEMIEALLFCSKGRVLSVDYMRRTFSKAMEESFGVGWTVSQYRQYHAGVVKAFCNSGQHNGVVSDAGAVSNLLHEQTGHSVSVANEIYGVAEVNMKKLDSVTMHNWRRASKKWQEMIGIEDPEDGYDIGSYCEGEGVDTELDAVRTIGREIAQLKRTICNLQEQFISRMDSVKGIGAAVSELKDMLNGNKYIVDSTSEHRKRNFREFTSTEQKSNVDADVILQGFRLWVGDVNANFRDTKQEMYFGTYCNIDCDHLFVLPTGYGKSASFMLQPFVRKDVLSIVIVPLVALKNDLLRRCEEKGISAVDWGNRYMHGAQIVFCSCEHVVGNHYAPFVREQYQTGKLHAIFMDEVHLLQQWIDFRTVFQRLGKAIRPANVETPVVGLTGSCPPSMERRLKHLLGLKSSCKVVRDSCARKNISYRVIIASKSIEVELNRFIFIGGGGEENWPKTKRRQKKKMVVYCLTRHDTEVIAKSLGMYKQVFNCFVGVYHAGKSKTHRAQVIKEWLSENYEQYIIIATSAFGCGVDYPDISVVIHYGCPTSIMGFLQESGRAGRDGEPAWSVVLHQSTGSDRGNSSDSSYYSVACESSAAEECSEHLIEAEKWTFYAENNPIFGSLKDYVRLGAQSCRRSVLDAYCDGLAVEGNCIERDMEACDLCSKQYKTEGKAEPIVIDLDSDTGEGAGTTADVTSRKHSKRKVAANRCSPPWRDSTYNTPDRCRERPVRRRLINELCVVSNMDQGTGSHQVSHSPSPQISNSMLKESIANLQTACAVCSVKHGRIISHKVVGVDEQDCAQYKGFCYRCASSSHTSSDCFTRKFRNRQGWCYSCSLSTHQGGYIHTGDSFGKKSCPVKNCIRILVRAFENTEARKKLNSAYPDVCNQTKPEEFVSWLRQTDGNGTTWFADVIRWVEANILCGGGTQHMLETKGN